MFKIAIVLFAVAAVAGLAMAVAHFRGQTPPKLALALLHGLFAASGLVVLLLGLIRIGAGGTPAYALGLFLVAALGGFTRSATPARPSAQRSWSGTRARAIAGS